MTTMDQDVKPTMYEPPKKPAQTDGNASFLRAARAGNLDKVLEYLKGSTDINTSNANGLNALHLASKEGHVNIVTELLKRGANVDAATKKGNTALHIASLAGQEEVVKILVQNNAKVNVQSQNGFTPLYMAAQEDHSEVVKFLLSNGASQSLATEDGFTPLAVALQQGHDKVVAVLLENDSRGKVRLPALHIAAKKDDTKAAALLLQNEHNVDNTSKTGGLVNDTTKSGFTPLHIAAHYGNINVGNLLIQKGADVNYKARNAICPLHVSSKWGRVNMVTLLLDNNGNIEARTRDGLAPLHCGARSGHEQVVDLLLERGALVGSKTKNGLTALHMAAQGDHVDCARLLLYRKAPIDDVTVDYLTPLHVAAHCGNVRTAKLLLDRKCEVNARALNGFTPLHIACKKNRIKVVELLLKYGGSIEATTESGLTPLHVASFMGHMNIVIYLIQHGASPDFPTIRGETALHLAARANQTDIIRILLRNGANVDAKAREQQTPLHIASRLGNVDIVVLLLQHGASPDAPTKDLYTSLHIAAKEGQEEVASVLLDHGASLNLTTKKGFTPLHIAAKYGKIQVARLLLQKDANPDVQGKNGLTPLHVATHYNNVNVALLLLESKASPHSSAKNGYTPLHIAAKKNQMDIATTLLEYGAKPNAESKNGFTPLHLATQEGHTDMVSLLLEQKGDVNFKAKNGITPMHLAAQEDKVPVAEILVKYGSEIDPQTKAGYTPLHTACHFGQINMIRFLLEHQASVNATTKLGYTPLHQAAQQGHVLVINLLLKYKASPNAVDNNGQTPLSIAQRLGYISVVEMLKHITEVTTVTTDVNIPFVSPERMEEGPMTDSEDEGGEEMGDTSFSRQSITEDMKYLMGDDATSPKFDGQGLFSPSAPYTPYSAYTPYPNETNNTAHFLFPDSKVYDTMQAYGGDSMSRSITGDSLRRKYDDTMNYEEHYIPLAEEEVIQAKSAFDSYAMMTSTHMTDDSKLMSYSGTSFDSSIHTDNIAVDRTPQHSGFLVSFMVDARGGAMRGCRHSGVRIIIPPRKACMPTRVTCKLVKKEKLTHPPPLLEGEALASRILEMGPVGAKFLGPVIIEVPHFASMRDREREIHILRSDNGETWHEHTVEVTEDLIHETLNGSFEGEDLESAEDLYQKRITRILTTDFPQYFAVVTRIRQEKNMIGNEGGMLSSTVVPQVQAVFPEGALNKKINVGLQVQPVQPELVSKMLGNRVAVSPIVTVEPRRRKFHKAITLTIPVPKASQKGMINTYSGDAPTLRLLCSITDSEQDESGTSPAQWEDITSNHPLTFVNDCVQFTTSVSARYWLMDCQNISEAAKMATELYRECISVPFMSKFVVFAKRKDSSEARLRVFCMTDDRMDKTLENQEHFYEVARSRDVEILEGKSQYLEMAGNLVPVTKSGEQLYINFHAFRENRLPFTVRVRDSNLDPIGRLAFMREPKVARGEAPQTPICNLNIKLPDLQGDSIAELDPDELKRRYDLMRAGAPAQPTTDERISRAELRLTDIADVLQGDWVILARQLNISEDEIAKIQTDYTYVSEQALVMLHLWVTKFGPNATGGNELERALRKIGRDDVVRKCMYNIETVTDEVERSLAKVQLDQQGFEDFKAELGPSRDSTLQRDMSLDVSYDEKDLVKESESAEEESGSESGSVVENKEFNIKSVDNDSVEEEAIPKMHHKSPVEDLVTKVEALKEEGMDDRISVSSSEDSLVLAKDAPEDQAVKQTELAARLAESEQWISQEDILDSKTASVTNTEPESFPDRYADQMPPQETDLDDFIVQEKMAAVEAATTAAEIPVAPQVKREVFESEPRPNVDVNEFEEVLDDGTLVKHKITTTTMIKTVTEITTSETADKISESRNTEETPVSVEITEEILKIPPGIDATQEEPQTEVSVSESVDKTPEGIPINRKIVTTRVVKQVPDEPKVMKEVVESEPESKTEVKESDEVLDDGTVIKRKITTSTIVKTIIEIIITETSEGPKEERIATEKPVEVFIVEEVTEIPPGLDEETIQLAPLTEPDVQETHDVSPDGVPVTRRVITQRVLKPQTSTETVESEPEEKVDVQEKRETLDDGTVIKRKTTTTTIVKIITEIITTETRQGPRVEKFAREVPVEIIILEEILIIAPGLDENSESITEGDITETREVLPEGIPVTRKIITRKVAPQKPTVTREVVESEPEPKIEVEEKQEVLDDGTIIKRKLTTSRIVKTVTEIIVTETPDGPKEERVSTEQPVEVIIDEEVTEIPPGMDEAMIELAPISEPEVEETNDVLPEGIPVRRKVVTHKILEPKMSREVVESEPKDKVDVEEKREVLEDGTIIKRKITTTTVIKTFTEIITTETREGPVVEQFAREEPVEIIILEEILEIPPGFDEDSDSIITEANISETRDVLPEGIPVVRKIITRKVAPPEPKVTREFIESEPEPKIDVTEQQETLDDGTIIKRKMTSTTVVKVITEVITTRTADKEEIKKVATEKPIEIIIEEEVFQIPPGFDADEAELQPIVEEEVEEIHDVLPDGVPIIKRVIPRHYVVEPAVDEQTVEAIPAEQLQESVPSSFPLVETEEVLPEGAEVTETEEVQPDGTVFKKRIIKSIVQSTIVIRIITTRPDGSITEEVITEDLMPPQTEESPSSGPSEKVEEEIPDDAEVDEYDETLPNGAVVRKRVIKIIRENVVITKVYTYHPDGSVSEDVMTEELPTSKPDQEVVIPVTQQIEESEPAISSPFDEDIPDGAEVDEYDETLPDGTVVRKRIVKYTDETKTITKTYTFNPNGEVNVQIHTVDLRPQEVTTIIDGPDAAVELDQSADKLGLRVYTDTIEGEPEIDTDVQEFEETLPDGTIVKRKVVKTRQKQTVVRRVIMEGSEDEIEDAPEIVQYLDSEMGEPETSTDVQEFEETLPDGTVVKRRVITTSERQLHTETTMAEGSGDIPFLTQRKPISEDDIVPDEQTGEERQPSAPRKQIQDGDLEAMDHATVEDGADMTGTQQDAEEDKGAEMQSSSKVQ